MKKKLSSLVLFIVTFSVFTLVFPVNAQNDKELPKGLEDKGPLTKVLFIHHKKGHAKPPWAGNGGNDKDKTSACYQFLAKGAKWKSTEPYEVNPTNFDNLDEDFVMDAIASGVNEWETYGGDIFDDGIVNYDAQYDSSRVDGMNTVSFGKYPKENVIAVTAVWGYFSGPPRTREIVEWDMLFNESSSWQWGDATINPGLMDLQNIATHELGHSAGMGDLYESSCMEETMYGYSNTNDIIKRDLNNGDIFGIQKLYH